MESLRPVNPDKTKWKNPARPRGPERRLHPGVIWSMRSKPVSKNANQCIYNVRGDLFTTLPSAGTVDWRHSGSMWHYSADVSPIYKAVYLDTGIRMILINGTIPTSIPSDGYMEKYFEVRPTWHE